MKLKTKKYFLGTLALLLVLSNFSFATSYMLCGMKDDDSSCCCRHQNHQPSKGISLSKEDSGCCSRATLELSNNNQLSTVKFELPKDITCFNFAILNTQNESLTNNNLSFHYITAIEHVPKSDIPILVSSLLI